MPAPADGKLLLLTLWERTSAKGNTYLSGFFGKACVVAFRGNPTDDGIPTWNLYLTPGREQTEATAKKPRSPARRTSADHAHHPGDGDGRPWDDAIDDVGR